MSNVRDHDDDQPEPTAAQQAAAFQRTRMINIIRDDALDGADADTLVDLAREHGLDGEALRHATGELELEIDARQEAVDRLNEAADLRDADGPGDDDDSDVEEEGDDLPDAEEEEGEEAMSGPVTKPEAVTKPKACHLASHTEGWRMPGSPGVPG